mmetsp:Transcript_51541/g.154746  ORF Transcript_51541/g.154746 Transcript_51541/m.154746 type:complete len:87 (-) Transcript_51541:1194-1454(-)
MSTSALSVETSRLARLIYGCLLRNAMKAVIIWAERNGGDTIKRSLRLTDPYLTIQRGRILKSNMLTERQLVASMLWMCFILGQSWP